MSVRRSGVNMNTHKRLLLIAGTNYHRGAHHRNGVLVSGGHQTRCFCASGSSFNRRRLRLQEIGPHGRIGDRLSHSPALNFLFQTCQGTQAPTKPRTIADEDGKRFLLIYLITIHHSTDLSRTNVGTSSRMVSAWQW